jgi:hypothetical protein
MPKQALTLRKIDRLIAEKMFATEYETRWVMNASGLSRA